jgi:hypothetical protein
MGDIYVEVGKIDASKAPKEYVKVAEASMSDAVKGVIKSAKGLTDKKGEGYTVRIKVTELKVEGNTATCKLAGELVRAPKAEMVSTSITNGATAKDSKPEAAVKQCVGAAAEAMMEKIVPVMKSKAR